MDPSLSRANRSSRARHRIFCQAYKAGRLDEAVGRDSERPVVTAASVKEPRHYLRHYARWLLPHRGEIASVLALGIPAAALQVVDPPSVTMVGMKDMAGHATVHARVHDRKSPSLATEWKKVVVEWTTPAGVREVAMRWYGEYLWRAQWPANIDRAATYRVCATDAAGNSSCGRR